MHNFGSTHLKLVPKQQITLPKYLEFLPGDLTSPRGPIRGHYETTPLSLCQLPAKPTVSEPKHAHIPLQIIHKQPIALTTPLQTINTFLSLNRRRYNKQCLLIGLSLADPPQGQASTAVPHSQDKCSVLAVLVDLGVESEAADGGLVAQEDLFIGEVSVAVEYYCCG